MDKFKCKCAERSAALKRAITAGARADRIAVARAEYKFVRQSISEDAKAIKDWLAVKVLGEGE